MAPVNVSFASTTHLAIIAIALGITYYIGWIFYNLFLHPLRSFPGPLANRISNLPRTYYAVRGKLPYYQTQLHLKYGSVVRLGPDFLTCTDPQAWKDIYGHKGQGELEFPKHVQSFRPADDVPINIISAGRDEHSFLRRLLAHGFSDRSMQAQDPIINAYVDKLIHRLRETVANGTNPINMRDWYTWTTFDVIGDLALGDSFNCLEGSDYHPWVSLFSGFIKEITYLGAFTSMGLRPVANFIAKYGSGLKNRKQHSTYTEIKLKQRMELGAERPDFVEGLIKNKETIGMEKLIVNSGALILAGSETTATLLCGVTYLLTTHTDVLKKLTDEVRSSFVDDAEITLISVNKLHYMLACLKEGLRRYPPIAGVLPRQVPKGGAMVAGHFVPEGTIIGVPQFAINHSPELWTDPMEFKPERFLDDQKYANDKIDSMQPFSIGPRNCVGKNLAYAEMRLILAKIIFNFDLALANESKGWMEKSRIFAVWEKDNLMIHLTPVKR